MGNKFKSKKDEFPQPRINGELRGNYNVRVVYPKDCGENNVYSEREYENKVMSLVEAKRLSDQLNLDLIEINPNQNPPILRIDDYGKWLYNEKKKRKENKQTKTELKEIQLSTNIGKHDLEIKVNKAREFILGGDKVKVVLTMRNRELSRREESKKCLYEFIVMMEDVATPESMPKDEGTKAIVILKKKK